MTLSSSTLSSHPMASIDQTFISDVDIVPLVGSVTVEGLGVSVSTVFNVQLDVGVSNITVLGTQATVVTGGTVSEDVGVSILVLQGQQPTIISEITEVIPVPTNLVAIGGNGNVDLSWDEVIEADSYSLEREVDDAGSWGNKVIITGISTNSYSDTGLNSDTTYRYRVRSVKNL